MQDKENRYIVDCQGNVLKRTKENTIKEILFTFLTAMVTYFVISNEYVRHVMFAFNELNLVIMFIVMLLGTYTGYRLTELTRFAPLINKDGQNV